MAFPISVTVHQEYALSLLLSTVGMDAIQRDLQQPVPWTRLDADHVMLACDDKIEVHRQVNGIELPRTSVFKYLGSAIASDGVLLVKANSRVSAAWSKWRSLTGVLWDKKVPERLKSKIYRAVFRPVAIYVAECSPATKEIERRLSVMEAKMLRWTAGDTRLDRARNDSIRQSFGVSPIVEKLREARLRWYDHVRN
ncbi:unnamed protein product [Heligmosomoides polygyrus]|uniref:RNA-directed DNA polymerase from mobile element jockey n=1 Tax=Heligmosomoides polygyrus TaxID=6339 RepID=A0A183GE58_HELPZ|nr:unnamed protein product [Heligmosomoides polygyrus]